MPAEDFARVLPRGKRAAGVKATERAVISGRAQRVLVAKDAEAKVVRNLLKICEDAGMAVEYKETMKELGALAGLRVGAAACAILKTCED